MTMTIRQTRGFKVTGAARTHTITKAEYDALDPSRPLTDSPIGTYTTSSRETQAAISAAIPTTPRPGGPR